MSSHALAPGDRFNPTQIFIGSFIPNVLMRYPGLSDGAKLVWHVLASTLGITAFAILPSAPWPKSWANPSGRSKGF